MSLLCGLRSSATTTPVAARINSCENAITVPSKRGYRCADFSESKVAVARSSRYDESSPEQLGITHGMVSDGFRWIFLQITDGDLLLRPIASFCQVILIPTIILGHQRQHIGAKPCHSENKSSKAESRFSTAATCHLAGPSSSSEEESEKIEPSSSHTQQHPPS